LAAAIAARDGNATVMVADSAALIVDDDETNRYFDAVGHDLCVAIGDAPAFDIPVGVIADLTPASSTSRQVEPFFGSRLRDWAETCLVSPSGFLSSRVAERSAATMRSSRGESFEVTAIGSVDLGPQRPPLVLADWLVAQARVRGIQVCDGTPLRRIVLEDEQVTGAVLDTPSGPRAIRARTAVLVSTGGHDIATAPFVMAEDATLQVSVVRQAASRFGRVELLTSQPLAATPHTTWRTMNRRLVGLAKEGRAIRLPHRRRGEVDRYPSLRK
jgi:hypothetical protein